MPITQHNSDWNADEADILWLAGLLEGEGSFTLNRGLFPTIGLAMTDYDVVEKAAKIMGVNNIYLEKKTKQGWKDAYRAQLIGYHAVRVMERIKPYMGERRTKKINEVLIMWNSLSHYREKGKLNECGHPDEKHYGRGMCRRCYMVWYKESGRGKNLKENKHTKAVPRVAVIQDTSIIDSF